MYNLSRGAHIGLIILFGSVLFLPFLGSVHLFDWDEINFAECAREMIVTGDYSNVKINFQPFWEKPPLFIWMQVLSMKLFGVNEFAARFPNAVCGIATLVTLYLIGTKTKDKKFGLLWVLAYAGSFLPHLYFKSGIIDPWFNLFIFLGIYNALLHTNNANGKEGTKTAALAALFIGLATLTKGPAAFLIFGLCCGIYWIIKKLGAVTSLKNILIFILVFIFTAGSWFLYEILSGNLQLVKDFFAYQVRLFETKDSGHGGFFGYHFVILLFGCFPASVFALRAWKRSLVDTPFQKHFKLWMNILFFVVLILFSIVETKIVHYSSLCYFPLTWLAAYSVYKMMSGEFEWKKWMTWLSVAISLIFGFLFVLIPLIDHFKKWILQNHFINDKFAEDGLSVDANWSGWEWLLGITFIFCTSILLRFITIGKIKLLPVFYVIGCLTMAALLILISPKIERYSQNPEIEFLKALRGKDCYIETVGFKSFAPLFYAAKQPEQNTQPLLAFVKQNMDIAMSLHQPVHMFSQYAVDWMLSEPITKPAYFIVKTPDGPGFQKEHPSFIKLYQKGGFVFFQRNPS